MQCFIYRSSRKANTYLYLSEKDDFSVLPAPLLDAFGEPQYCFDFELSVERELAQADPAEVMASIEEQGFYLQMQKENGVEI